MFAVVQSGGHQYRVKAGDKIIVDRIEGSVGDKIKLDKVLATGDGSKFNWGAPLLSGATVEAKIAVQDRADKILVFKYRRRKNSKKIQGHRQDQTTLEISKINA